MGTHQGTTKGVIMTLYVDYMKGRSKWELCSLDDVDKIKTEDDFFITWQRYCNKYHGEYGECYGNCVFDFDHEKDISIAKKDCLRVYGILTGKGILPENIRIYFSGNPVLWWLAGLSLIFVLLSSTTKNSRRRLSPIFYILLLGYFANLLPFIFVNRVAFLYHYLPTAMYAILILSLLLINFRSKSKTFFWITIALIIFGFIITAPLSYGWLLPPQFSQLATQFIILFN